MLDKDGRDFRALDYAAYVAIVEQYGIRPLTESGAREAMKNWKRADWELLAWKHRKGQEAID